MATGGRASRRESALLALDRARDALAVPALRSSARDVVRRTGLTRSGQTALVAAVVPWIVAYLVAGTALYIFSYATVLVVGMAFVMAPRRLRLTAERAGLFPRAQEGDRLEVVVRLEAQRRISTFLLDERIPERLGAPVRVPIATLAPGAPVDHTYSLDCGRRGAYRVGPLTAVAGDPFGLTQRETVLCEAFELVVHPRVELVDDRPLTRQFEDPPVRPPVSKPWPSGMEFFGMREYHPGDELRRVVWRASARVGKLMVREAEQGITDRITIVLDTDRGSYRHTGEDSEAFEVAVRAAASIGVGHLRDGYEVRCETNGGPLTRVVRGPQHVTGFLDALARVETGRSPLVAVLRRLAVDARRDAHHVVVTPRLRGPEAAQLKLLLDTGVSVAVVALLWDDDDSETMGRAASLGCAVSAVHPGDDLRSALSRAVGAGVRL